MERHRIHEYYSEADLNGIHDIIRDPRFSNNNQRLDEIMLLLKHLDPTFIAAGTNRMTILIDDYVHKIAFDSRGIRDNWNEFNISPHCQPYVTKTYESNGYIDIAEYVNLMQKDEFVASKEHIAAMLEVLAQDWLFCDISLTNKNFLNYGFRDNDEIVILDYGLEIGPCKGDLTSCSL